MPPNRREYLTLLALVKAGALAGCTGDDDEDELEPVDDEEADDEDAGNDGEEDIADDDREEDDEDGEDDELRQMDLSFGDTVEHPDGYHITPFEPEIVDGYETETMGETEEVEPENEQFVFIEIEIENVSDSTIETPNVLDFEAIVADQQFEPLGLTDQRPVDDEPYPSLEDLAAGSGGSGDVIFDTPSGEVELFYSGLTEDLDDVEAIWS